MKLWIIRILFTAVLLLVLGIILVSPGHPDANSVTAAMWLIMISLFAAMFWGISLDFVRAGSLNISVFIPVMLVGLVLVGLVILDFLAIKHSQNLFSQDNFATQFVHAALLVILAIGTGFSWGHRKRDSSMKGKGTG